MVQSKIEKDCVATAATSLADIVAQGTAWLADEGLRCSLEQVMPQAAAAVAAQRHQHHAGAEGMASRVAGTGVYGAVCACRSQHVCCCRLSVQVSCDASACNAHMTGALAGMGSIADA
jgi:hypothetical protein